MKKLFLISLLLIANHIFAQVTVSLHHYDYFNLSDKTKSVRSTVSMYARKSLGSSFTVTSFSLVNNKWGESLIGLEYSPLKWLALEAEIGIESDVQSYGYRKNLIRRAELVTISTHGFLFLGTFEQGSIPWFDLRALYLTKQIGFGAMASQYYGYGPLIQYHFGKSPFTIWSSVIYNWENSNYGSMVGLYFKMK